MPVVKRGKLESTRIEYRAPDPACNPYLAFAVILAAGLQGHRGGLRAAPPRPPPTSSTMTPEELAAEGIRPLPGSLNEAVDEMERSELVAETLGEHVFEWFIRNKRAEWAAYKTPHHASSSSTATSRSSERRAPGPLEEPTDGTAALLPRSVPGRAGARPSSGAGYPWKAVARPEHADADEPEDGWAGAVVVRRRRRPERRLRPVPAACAARDVPARARCCSWSGRRSSRTSSCARTSSTTSACCRLDADELGGPPRPPLLAHRPGAAARAHRVRAARAQPRDLPGGGRRAGPLDLTYMEYELLRFLAAHPGKVFTRETLLSRVWGYEYYGGARTVDVHVRRLRAKLGEEHAHLIETVRSVGYRFGQARWAPSTAARRRAEASASTAARGP